MNRLATLLIVSLLTTLGASIAFAAGTETSPATTATTQPAVTAAPSMEKTVKIGYIEVAKIARESAGGKAAAATLKAKLAKLQTRIEAKQKQLEKQKKALEEKLEGKSVSERAARGKEFQKKVAEYQKLVRTSEEEMQKAQLKLTSALYTVIKDAASTYAKSHGYLVVVDEKAILYLADKIDSKDLTEEIAASLHEKPAK